MGLFLIGDDKEHILFILDYLDLTYPKRSYLKGWAEQGILLTSVWTSYFLDALALERMACSLGSLFK